MSDNRVPNTIDKLHDDVVCATKVRGSWKIRRHKIWGGLTVCFVVTIVTFFCILSDNLNRQNTISTDIPDECIDDYFLEDTIVDEQPKIHVEMSNIVFNELEELTLASPKPYDPEFYDELEWGTLEISTYYGTALTPAYIPVSVEPTYHCNIVSDKAGTLVSDTVWGYYYEPTKSVDNEFRQGFFITVSKIGILNDCIYLLPESEVKTSYIDGTAVTFGHRSAPYGPFDPNTQKPSGYYDMYVAEFEHRGIKFQIVSEQMEKMEMLKVVSSIICECETVIHP